MKTLSAFGGEGGEPGEVVGTASAHLILSFSPLKGGEGTHIEHPFSYAIARSRCGRGL